MNYRHFTNSMSDNYIEETKPLFKLLRTEAFRFVIVRYNHYLLIRRMETDLRALFPDRQVIRMDARTVNYSDISTAYFSMERGFFFIEHFEDVLTEEMKTTSIASSRSTDNERRIQITAGMNLRRDKFARLPVAIFVFIPDHTSGQYTRIIMKRMPDWWSLRSAVLDLKVKLPFRVVKRKKMSPGFNEKETRYLSLADDSELARLHGLLKQTPQSETAYRLTLFPQIVEIAGRSGLFELAHEVLEEWVRLAPTADKSGIFLKKGELYLTEGKTQEAVEAFEEAKAQIEYPDEEYLASINLRVGEACLNSGNTTKALSYFNNSRGVFEKLLQKEPGNSDYMKGKAFSCNLTGDACTESGEYREAIVFYNISRQLVDQLCESNPGYRPYKLLLSDLYDKLGKVCLLLGDYSPALAYFKSNSSLTEELYHQYPYDAVIIGGLAASYRQTGEFYEVYSHDMDTATLFYRKAKNCLTEFLATNHLNTGLRQELDWLEAKLETLGGR